MDCLPDRTQNNLQYHNPDFIYNFSMPNEEPLELSACEIIIGIELKEDVEFDRIIDVFTKFNPDLEKYISFVHEFRIFNKALGEITIGILKCSFLQERGYSQADSIVLTNLSNPFAQELIKCLHEHKKMVSEDYQIDQVCENWHYNKMYGIDDSNEDVEELFDEEKDKLDDLPF